jgi:hypothetical protein
MKPRFHQIYAEVCKTFGLTKTCSVKSPLFMSCFLWKPTFLQRKESMTKSDTIIESEDFTKSLQKRHFSLWKNTFGYFQQTAWMNCPSGCFRIALGYSQQVSQPDINCTPVTITVICHKEKCKLFGVNGNDSNRVIPITVFRGFGFLSFWKVFLQHNTHRLFFSVWFCSDFSLAVSSDSDCFGGA